MDMLDLGGWFILRTANVDTMKTFSALQREGFDVWTPIERKVKRSARTRAPYDSTAALMPSYLFARVEHLDDILKLSRRTNRGIPKFTVFHHGQGIPLVSDSALDALRMEEDRLGRIFDKAKLAGMKRPQFGKGKAVRTGEGPFMGMSGIVEGQQGQFTLVSFAGFHDPIKISSILLVEEVSAAQAA
jgi:transcription antitermination factor NusG